MDVPHTAGIGNDVRVPACDSNVHYRTLMLSNSAAAVALVLRGNSLNFCVSETGVPALSSGTGQAVGFVT